MSCGAQSTVLCCDSTTCGPRLRFGLICWMIVAALASVQTSQVKSQSISYPDPTVHFIYPAGGQQGTTVKVRFGPLPVLTGATQIIVDGPEGITASDIERTGDDLGATFTIAPNAQPGRRMVRIVGGSSGLTCFRYFFVGRLPEVLENEPNDAPAKAEEIALPTVINGRIQADLDIDCFVFQARAGQRITAAVLAHRMDSCVYADGGMITGGFLDTTLEILDEHGRTVSAAGDTLGLDPVLDFEIPTAGRYTVRVQSTGLRGSPACVYRLTIGDVPYPTCVFPSGGSEGEISVEIGGFNQTEPAQQSVSRERALFGVHYLADTTLASDGHDLPLVWGDIPEIVEAEPNNDASRGQPVQLPLTVNGRFESTEDEDWYRVPLQKGKGVLLEVLAERVLHSPIDSLLEVFDAAGKKLDENDDGPLFARPNHCAHDFSSADSWLQFQAPADGEYFVRVSNQGGEPGPRAIYRLSASPLQPDFILDQWPDAVPIWGAGTTACFLVELRHWGGLTSDVDICIEGLPEGWRGSSVRVSPPLFENLQPPLGFGVLLSVTSPHDAKQGTVAPFRVVGRIEQDGRVVEHEARYHTLYGHSHNDGMLLRESPAARAVVAPPLDCRLETTLTEITAHRGETVHIPVRIERLKDGAPLALVVNGSSSGVGCGMAPPMEVGATQDEFLLPLTIGPQATLGRRGIVVARSWASDFRSGRPGPCTPLIHLDIRPEDSASK